MGVVDRNLESESCQHVLIVASRGMGKTMLLARIEAELRADSRLAAELIPVRLMEESYGVASLTDFWLEVLYQLSLEFTRRGFDAASELKAAHASFCERWRDTQLQIAVVAAIEEGLSTAGRRMVLMVENLQALSAAWEEDAEWGLRGNLQTNRAIMLIGSATARFRSLEDADRAFFELFRQVELGPLTTRECAALWRTATRQRLEESAIRPLEILTGGSPRLLILLAGLGRRHSLTHLLEELVGLIDEHTQYFRQCLETLPLSERRVFLALADLWEPASTSEVASRARMDVRITSVMLGRLVEKGAVSRSSKRPTRRYSLTERLFCFYYVLRRERDQSEIVRRFIAFMVAFYDPSVAATALSDLSDSSDTARAVKEQLLSAIVVDDAVFRWVEKGSRDFTASMNHLWTVALSNTQKLIGQHAKGELADEAKLSKSAGQLKQLLSRNPGPAPHIQLAELILEGESSIPAKCIIDLGEAILNSADAQRFAQSRDFGPWAALTRLGMARAFLDLRNYEEARRVCDDAMQACADLPELNEDLIRALVTLVRQNAFLNSGDYDSSISECREYLERISQREEHFFRAHRVQSMTNLILAETLRGNPAGAEEGFRILESGFGSSQEPAERIAVANATVWMILACLGGDDKARISKGCDLFDTWLTRLGVVLEDEIRDLAADAADCISAICTTGNDLRTASCSIHSGMERCLTPATDSSEVWAVRMALARADILVRLHELPDAEKLAATWLPETIRPVDETGVSLRWRAELILFECYLADRNETASTLFKSIAQEFNSENVSYLRKLNSALIRAGAREENLGWILELLKDESELSRGIWPVVVALRLSRGEEVSAPLEVLQVATDVWNSMLQFRSRMSQQGD